MKNRTSYLKRYLAMTFAGMLFSTPVLAAEDITSLINYLQKVVNTTVQSVADSIYEFNTLLPRTVATNLTEVKNQQIAETYSKALTFCQVYNMLPRHQGLSDGPPLPEDLKSLGTEYKNSDDLCKKMIPQNIDRADPAALKKQLANLPATDHETPKKFGGVFRTSAGSADNPALYNGNFNFENLIIPTLYDEKTRENALGFVAFAGRTYEPFPLDVGTWRQVLEQKSTRPAFIDYQMALRSYVAAQSTAVGNLYRLIADRTEQPSIANLKLKNDEGVDVKSLAQYQAYLATHRTNNPSWYVTMNSASSNTVSREILFVLAEIQRSLYRLEQTNERLLATLSVSVLLQLNSNVRPELKSLVPAVEELVREPAATTTGG